MELKYFATTNDHKLKEVNALLGFDLEKVDVDLMEPQFLEVEDIARFKAEQAFLKVGKPVLVEDTGWYIEAWNGLPGAFAKWFMEADGCDGILRMLGDEQNRKVKAKTVVAYHDGSEIHVFVGETTGTVPMEKRGTSEFGYDRIFLPDGYEKTFGEMTTEEKNEVSMRGAAVRKLKAFLDEKTE